MDDVAIFGNGGHAKVVIDTMRQTGRWRPVVCFGHGSDCLSVPVVPDDQAGAAIRAGTRLAIIAVGDALLRDRLAAKASLLGYELITVVSPQAYVADSVRIGAGAVVMAGAVVQPDSDIGDLAIVNTRCSIDHDSRVGRLAHIAPGATLCGYVEIGVRAWVGAGAVVLERRRVADGVIVAGGAVVTRDIVVPGSRYAGVPAMPMRTSATTQ